MSYISLKPEIYGLVLCLVAVFFFDVCEAFLECAVMRGYPLFCVTLLVSAALCCSFIINVKRAYMNSQYLSYVSGFEA
jgi:hypothetical protein